MSSPLATPWTIYTGRLAALPAVTNSAAGDFRLIRPLVYVSEAITTAYAAQLSAPVIPCGCSQKTGTVRGTLRSIFKDLEAEHPFLKENLLSAMGNLDPSRLLDPRYLPEDCGGKPAVAPSVNLFPVVMDM